MIKINILKEAIQMWISCDCFWIHILELNTFENSSDIFEASFLNISTDAYVRNLKDEI